MEKRDSLQTYLNNKHKREPPCLHSDGGGTTVSVSGLVNESSQVTRVGNIRPDASFVVFSSNETML